MKINLIIFLSIYCVSCTTQNYEYLDDSSFSMKLDITAGNRLKITLLNEQIPSRYVGYDPPTITMLLEGYEPIKFRKSINGLVNWGWKVMKVKDTIGFTIDLDRPLNGGLISLSSKIDSLKDINLEEALIYAEKIIYYENEYGNHELVVKSNAIKLPKGYYVDKYNYLNKKKKSEP